MMLQHVWYCCWMLSTGYAALLRKVTRGAPSLVDLMRVLHGPRGQWLMLMLAKMRTVGADGGSATVCGCCWRFSTCERRVRPLWSTPTAALLMLWMLMSSPIMLLAMLWLLLAGFASRRSSDPARIRRALALARATVMCWLRSSATVPTRQVAELQNESKGGTLRLTLSSRTRTTLEEVESLQLKRFRCCC